MVAGARCPDFAAILREAPPDGSVRELLAGCFHEELGRQARRRCRDEALAEDAAQEALLTALESLGAFRGDGSLEGWLRRLVVSACSRLRRGRKNDPAWNRPLDEAGESSAAATADPGQESAVLLAERIQLLEEALAELGDESRAMLLLHEGQEVPLDELATRFGTTVDGVKSRLKRARARVRARLIELAEGEAT